MRAKPSSSRSAKTRTNGGKSGSGSSKGGGLKKKENDKKKSPDFSVLRQPVDTSISGLKQAVKVFETGTPEVLHLLTYDCEVIYECKVCRNLFRSLANFISHKRVYCTARYSPSHDLQRTNKEGEDFSIVWSEKPPDRLPTRITARKDLTSIVESFSGQRSASEGGGSPPGAERKTTTVHLEPMENTSYGVFQTVFNNDPTKDLMKNQVAELETLLSKNEVVLGPDGRVLQNGLTDFYGMKEEQKTGNENGFRCDICNLKCATRKTLLKHRKNHESIKTSYVCPCCKNVYCNPWSVYRHLYKAHRKTNEQVRKLRPQIQKKVIHQIVKSPSLTSGKKVNSPEKSDKRKSEEIRQMLYENNMEWMNHLEVDGEFQRCGGCGRKFERKAALLAHAQICQKRIDVCNSNDQSYQAATRVNLTPVVALKAMTCTKKPAAKRSPEKRIGIQVRMNYCKGGPPCARQRSESRSVRGDDESDADVASVDGRDSLLRQAVKASTTLKEDGTLDRLAETSDGANKADSGVGAFEIATSKSSAFSKSNSRKNTLEEKCLQLRSAMEIRVKGENDGEKCGGFLNGTADNVSESGASAVSSLSSQLIPLVDKCEADHAKGVNVSQLIDDVTHVEDEMSRKSDGSLIGYTGENIKQGMRISPHNTTVDEDSAVMCDEGVFDIHDFIDESNSNCLKDDEISVDLKPELPTKEEVNRHTQDSELENTISILTRNQLKAICKDDILPPSKDDKKKVTVNGLKKNSTDLEVEAATKQFIKSKLSKYVDETDKSCTICQRKFKKIVDIYKHIRIHTRWKRYKCLFEGCKFQTFLKSGCLHHAMLHLKDLKDSTPDSLVGMIDPSLWNVRLNESDRKNILKGLANPNVKGPKVVIKKAEIKNIVTLKKIQRIKKAHNKVLASPKISAEKEPIKNIALKSPTITLKSPTVKLKSPTVKNQPLKMSKKTKRQKLLTDFNSFRKTVKENQKVVATPKIEEIKKLKIIKRNVNQPKRLPVKLVSNKVKIEISEEIADSMSDKPTKKRQRVLCSSSPAQTKKKFSPALGEHLHNDIIVNHVLADGSGPLTAIRTAETLEGSSSLEEEESQELDNVDETHLKKIFMEVIFGPPAAEVAAQQPAAGRPVRNKTRPKRDNDFVLGSQKDTERDLEDKTAGGKRTVCSSQDSKLTAEAAKKSK